MPHPRPTLLAAFLTATCLITAVARPAAAQDASRPPNIVFIFSDDLTRQAISCYGDSRDLLQTPNMDRIARDGMRFDRCYVTNSICGPSRATVLTGKYSHLNGFFNNTNSVFDGSQSTFPKKLQKAGYQTAVVGKWHLGSDPTGFDYWHILPGQGHYYNPIMIEQGRKHEVPGYVTDIITEQSIGYLERRDRDKPFVLMMQHKAPHREWEPALRHLGWNEDRDFAEPESLADDFAGRSKAVSDHDMGLMTTMNDRDLKLVPPARLTPQQRETWDAYYDPRNAAKRNKQMSPREELAWRYQRYMHDYLACVKAVDESVGTMLKYLDDNGLAENTIVVCTSDQGFYLGEHGWFDKRWIFEESASTPLMIRWPGHTPAGSVCEEIVSLMDFAPTFCQVANADPVENMQGQSMVPLLNGHTPADWRQSLYYHYYEYPVPHRVRPHYGLITKQHKLVRYYGPDVDDWELLDRQANPAETQDFYDDPAYAEVRQKLLAELAQKKAEALDAAAPPRAAYGKQQLEGDEEQMLRNAAGG